MIRKPFLFSVVGASLAVALAVHGCGSDATKSTGDGGDINGDGGVGTADSAGTAGSSGTGGSTGTAGATGTAGSTGTAGATGTAGSGGTAGSTGAQIDAAADAPATIIDARLPDAAAEICRAGQKCTANCATPCGRGNTGMSHCICSGGTLFCSNICEIPDGGAPADAAATIPACPAMPSGKVCGGANVPNQCVSNIGDGGSAVNCLCINSMWRCDNDGTLMMCPNNPNGKDCTTENEVCSAGNREGCVCTRRNGSNQLRWACGFVN